MPEYQVVEVAPDSDIPAYQPYGAAADLWLCKDHEIIIAGPAETGKTRGALEKIDALAWKYAGAQMAMLRKTYKSMPGSVIQTYEKKVLGAWNEQDGRFDATKTPVRKYGGEKPEWYDYPNGTRLWVGGMDNPAKVLSSERDFVYINQAEELSLDEWETILTRVTGRAGNAPYTQVMGDANPGPRHHWILERANVGKLKLLNSRHEDNPTLFDQETGEITSQGKITLSILDGLSGVRYQRLRLGKWVSAEGQIYSDYDPAIHLIPRFDIPAEWRRFRVIDFGLVHPFVCLWVATDHDGRMFVYRYIYMTGRTVATHADEIKRLSKGEAIEQTVCDHDAEDRLTLEENGIPNIPAKKDVLHGIGKVQDRLKKQIDDKPRLFILQDSLVEVDQSLKQFKQPYQLEDEFDLYIWKNNAKKEEPVKDYDHGLDALRYAVMYLDGPDTVIWKSPKFAHL